MINEINKFKTRKEIAQEYGVDRKTFLCMLVRYNIEFLRGLILLAYQARIYEVLEKPALTKINGG